MFEQELLGSSIHEEEDKITYEELLRNHANIRKKVVIINSTKYTDEAFDYLLDLVDQNEAIAFVPDERQIYTQGTWFGGDVWEDTLEVFSKFVIIGQDGEVSGTVTPSSIKDVLEVQGEGGIELYAEYDAFNDQNRIHIKYKLESAVDDQSIVSFDNDEKISLAINNDKISLKKYNAHPITIGNLDVLEYDTPQAHISIPVEIDDISKISFIRASSDVPTNALFDFTTRTVTALVPANTDVNFTIDYTYDGANSTEHTTQKWGYGWYYGSTRITSDTFSDLVNGIEPEFEDKSIIINQPIGRYGWIAYPKEYELIFIDEETGIGGGWIKDVTFTKYSKRIEYQVYRTKNAGLGEVRWKITKKQRN